MRADFKTYGLHPRLWLLPPYNVFYQHEMTQSSCKRDTKSKSHPCVKLAPVRVFSCKHPLNRPRSIYQYSNMAPRLSGQNSIFGVVSFVSKSLLGIEGQKKLEKFAILTRKPRSRARILIYRTWPIPIF